MGRLQDATSGEEIKTKAQAVRMRSVKQDIKGKQSFLAAYDEQLAQLTRRAQQEQERDLNYRKNMASTQRTLEEQQRSISCEKRTSMFKGEASTMHAKLSSLATGLELGYP